MPEHIADTNNWYDWNGDLGNTNDREVNLEADNECNKEQENGIGNADSTARMDVLAILPNVARLMRPPLRSRKQADKVLMMVNTIETKMNKGMKAIWGRICQWILTWFFM